MNSNDERKSSMGGQGDQQQRTSPNNPSGHAARVMQQGSRRMMTLAVRGWVASTLHQGSVAWAWGCGMVAVAWAWGCGMTAVEWAWGCDMAAVAWAWGCGMVAVAGPSWIHFSGFLLGLESD